MTIQYHIYSNHGTGGPVDLTTPLVTTADLSCVIGPLNTSTDNTFLVRAFQIETGLEEANTVASVRVSIGPDGLENSGLPNAPHALNLSSVPGGGCLISWAYAPALGQGLPDSFHIYLTAGVVDYSVPTATVAFLSGQLGYSFLVPGPLAPGTYSAAVRSFNSAGNEINTAVRTANIGRSIVPYIMDQIQAVAVKR